MKEKNNNFSLEFGGFVTAGLVLAAAGVDLVGRLLFFLYGEWPYVCAGLVVVTFFGINFYVHSSFNDVQWSFQKSIESKLNEFELKLSHVGYDKNNIQSEIKFMQKSLSEHWRVCENTIIKIEKLIEQKTPVIIETPQSQPQQLTEQNVQDAIEEVVGGVV